MDQLRSFVTVLVVAHHAAMAYVSFGRFHREAYILSTHPIVDAASVWKGFDVFIGFNDIYFMPLMFLISGNFVLYSIEKRGRRAFVRERFVRLFVPFLLAVTFLMPIAYYPAWLAAGQAGSAGTVGIAGTGMLAGHDGTGMLAGHEGTGVLAGHEGTGVLAGHDGLVGTGVLAGHEGIAWTDGLPETIAKLRIYLADYFSVEAWPVGPPWFIWELFAFNLILIWAYPWLRGFLNACATALDKVRTPLEVLLIGYMITWVAYVPFAGLAGPYTWTGIGPLDFQVSRVLLYFVYFLVGAVLGRSAIAERLAERWHFWVYGALIVWGVYLVSDRWLPLLHVRESATRCICRSVWSLSCVMSCAAFLALFKRGGGMLARGSGVDGWRGTGGKGWRGLMRGDGRGWREWFWSSLSVNAYGIYLVHYVLVVWLQYLLMPLAVSGLVKFFVVLILGLGGSWGLVAGWKELKGRIGPAGVVRKEGLSRG